MTRQRPEAVAFTLIEVLVCIAVIAVLIAVVLPSLRWARRSGEGAACVANLHSFGTSITLYRDANRSLLPFADSNVDVRAGLLAPLSALMPYMECKLPSVDTSGRVVTFRPFLCPVDREIAQDRGWSYVYTPTDMMGTYPLRTVSQAIERDPATVIVCDGMARHAAKEPTAFIFQGQNVLRIDGAAMLAAPGASLNPGF